VLLLAVSKTQSVEAVREAFEAGAAELGENYVQEMVEKHEVLATLPVRWHAIGHLQRNKVRQIVPWVTMIHGVDSERLAKEIDRQAVLVGRCVPVLVQVNVSREHTKSGVMPEEALPLVEAITRLPGVEPAGLMAIPAPADHPEASRPAFRALRELRETIASTLSLPLPHLSMGMTDDFEIAIEEGATIVRIGSAIFGERTAKAL